MSSHKIANLGIGYVPQGRRLFPSLTVDEHLRMSARGNGSRRWTIASVYELFPGSPSGSETAAPSSRAASSRCSPSAAHSSRTRSS